MIILTSVLLNVFYQYHTINDMLVQTRETTAQKTGGRIQRGSIVLIGTFTCDHCGTVFEKRLSQMIAKRYHFCSKRCTYAERKTGGLVHNHLTETMLQKFGVKNAFQSDVCKAKIKQTCLIKFDTEHPQQSQAHRDNLKQINLKRWQHVSEEEIRNRNAKRIQTCLTRYGVDHPMKDPTIVNKAMTTRSDNHKPTKTISRGERFFFDLLQMNNDLSTKSQIWVNGFFVDFIIETLGLIIEFDGDYWHDEHSQEPRIMKKVARDQKLNVWCESQQKRLFRIKESELCRELNFTGRKLPRQSKLQDQITVSNSNLILRLLTDVMSHQAIFVRYSDIRS